MAVLVGRAIRNREGTERLLLNIAGLEGLQGKVGWFETAKYPDGTSVAYVASIHEFGYPEGGIPARSFMRSTAMESSKQWTLAFGRGVKAIASGTFNADQVMESVTLLAVGDIKKKISEIQSPPLAPATIAARRRRYKNKALTGNLTKPLVDTSLMVSSITNVVERK